jgi:predicted nucleic acid-binding protein
MAYYVFDSSTLGKHYHAEIGTAFVEALLHDPGAQHFMSRLTVVEIHSVFAGKVRTGVIAAADFQLLRVQLQNDIGRRLVRVLRMTDAHYQEAEGLLGRYGLLRRLRTLDALQLAVALDLHRRGMCDHFVCADQRLGEVAQQEGLSLLNPEQP